MDVLRLDLRVSSGLVPSYYPVITIKTKINTYLCTRGTTVKCYQMIEYK